MEQYIKDQILYGLRHVPANLLKSYFIRKRSPETVKLREKGYICGVCHPNDNYEQIKAANIGWIRRDIPFPYDEKGNLQEAYLSFKSWALEYKKNGIKVMGVTPYPYKYIAHGVDIRTKEGEKRTREIAGFLIQDMQGIVDGIQITNEMGIPHFTLPLTMDEAAKFIGIHLEEMYGLRKDMIIGYNSALIQADLHRKMKPYYQYCDYIGMDIYMGCFGNMTGRLWFFEAALRYLWAMTGKPLILQEFGYISDGEPKTRNEKNTILRQYGAVNEEEAREHIEEFVEKLPERLRTHVKHVCKNESSHYFDLLFRSMLSNHLYCELPPKTKIPGYPHTKAGQAAFFRDLMKRLKKLEFLCGTIVYCYSDSDSCYICGQSDCPTETRWGLVDREGNPKPSYYAIQEAFGEYSDKSSYNSE